MLSRRNFADPLAQRRAYESRLAKLSLKDNELPAIDD